MWVTISLNIFFAGGGVVYQLYIAMWVPQHKDAASLITCIILFVCWRNFYPTFYGEKKLGKIEKHFCFAYYKVLSSTPNFCLLPNFSGSRPRILINEGYKVDFLTSMANLSKVGIKRNSRFLFKSSSKIL